MNQSESKEQGKSNLPPSLPLDESTFKTYNTSVGCVFSDNVSSINGYQDKDYPSYHRNPVKTMSSIEQCYEVYPPLPPPSLLIPTGFPSFTENPSSSFRSFEKVSHDHNLIFPDNTADLIYSRSNGTVDPSLSQQYFNNDHYYLPRKPLTSSFSSSYPSVKKNSNDSNNN
mmetsp:Transcript_8303/g.9073  ORF Transcript_8303/g.9073 Transcript_8303/m.9073 type:complete len:170 (-) Transcript_8303:38-547(-)